MEQNNGQSFNCTEGVLLRVNRNAIIPGFNQSCMCIASVLGGGMAGNGEISSALNGRVMRLALLFRMDGEEPLDVFNERRVHAQVAVSNPVRSFTDNWENIQCRFLLVIDQGKEPAWGLLRSESPRNLCEEYVNWIANMFAELLKTRVMNLGGDSP